MCYNCKKEGSDEMLSHKDFYYLSKVISDSCTQCIPLGYDELPDDERQEYFKGGNHTQNMPKVFVRTHGRKMNALINGAIGLYLVSKELKEKFENSEITGIEYIPVEIETKSGTRHGDYYAMPIIGRAKAADRKAAVPKYIEAEPQNMWRDVGYFFPLDSWDGSDIFYLEGSTSVIIVSEKAKEILSQYSDCCKLTRCDEYIWSRHSMRFKTMKEATNRQRSL